MTNVTPSFDETLALEKMNYTRYELMYNVRRPNQAPSKIDAFDTMTLPTGSVLHTLNGLDSLEPISGGLPDPSNPLIVNEKLPIWLKINTALASESAQPFGVKDSYTYRPNVMIAQIQHFFQSHKHIHRVLSDRTLRSMTGALTWIDHSPLNEAKVGGTLHAYRKFDILFRTILDMVVSIGTGKHHYILLPQSDHVFARSMLQRSFKDLSTGTLSGVIHDPSIFPLIHVLGYIYGKTHELDVTPYKEDVKILGKDSDVFNQVKSTSLLERMPTSLFSSINFIFQRGKQAVVYNLGDIATFSEDPTFYLKFYRHMMNLRMGSVVVPDQTEMDDEQYDDYVKDVASGKEVPKVIASPTDDTSVVSKTPTAVDPKVSDVVVRVATPDAPTPTIPASGFEDRIRTAAIVHTSSAIALEPKKESRRNALLENHLKATLGGKTLGELIQPLSNQAITPKSMNFVTSAPEASYQKSSLLAMDKAYQTHGYHHELAKVVSSLAKHGMFVTKTEEVKTHTEMDRTTTYKLDLSDINGKTHHVKFTVPSVDEDGLMKLSGIDYRLTRQIANVPICKISPTQVNLSSYYNKIRIERIQSKRFSYEHETVKLINGLKAQGLLSAVVGSAPMPTTKVANDYTAVGRNFTEVSFGSYLLQFGGDHAPFTDKDPKADERIALSLSYGAYVGTGPHGSLLFWNTANRIVQIKDKQVEKTWSSFHHMLIDLIGDEARPARTPVEWTQANIINQTIPLVYILAYRLGLKRVLEMINLDYRFYTNRGDIQMNIDDIAVPMADGTLVFNRYPLSRSLIAGGLLWTDLKSFQFQDLSIPDTYIRVFQQKKMSPGVLKGLSGFFDFFVDPITETVLEKMHEPITFPELLLRANVMLTDYHAVESSSVSIHRFRLYERFNGIVYNEIFRALSNHRGNPSTKKSFSINPEAVFQKIVQDATISPNEVINPVHEVKQRANFTFTGGSGRTGRSFVIKDLIYPKDGLGVISENVPDSGKVGITSYLSSSPNIDDIHGIPKPYKPGDTLEPPQILSIGSMVMPGGTTDDGKRNNYLSIQISHYVPNHDDGETLAVRTGYDAVLPHLSTNVFAIAATDDGVVESIDEKQQVLRVRYADKKAESLGSLKLPYLDTLLDTFRREHTSFGYLVTDADITRYPMGGVFTLTHSTYGKVVDRLRCESVDAIPDKEVARKQNTLIQDFIRGKYKALYYIRFTPISNTIPGDVKSYAYGDIYSQNSGAYLLQTRKPNVKLGDKFKTGDILIYNPGFFVPDPMSKQVTFKHGVTATVALVEKSSNHEDACEISRDFAKRLEMKPAHQREVITKNTAAILASVKVGDHVETSDSLCVISDDYLIGSSLSLNVENLDIIEKLNRQSPSANYTGVVRKIRILYGGEREELSETLKTILKVYEKEVRDNFKALNNDPSIKPPEKPGWVAPGTKYAGVSFTKDTVILEYMIDEALGMSEGDKLVIANSSKSIVSYVNEKSHHTESGIPIDILFSTTGVINRIVASPFLGIAERNLAELKKQVLSMYFD
jgi:hypothetical protein